jgi:hypothetical protein
MGTVLLVKHRVADFDDWKKIFDDAKERRTNGYEGAIVYRDRDDPNVVYVLFKVFDIEAAKRHTHSFTLIDGMAKAGVRTAPEFHFLDEADVQTY